MKRVLIFIGLKIAELFGVFISYLLLSRLGYFLKTLKVDETNPECWYSIYYFLCGAFCLGIVSLILIVLYYAITEWIPEWLESNWDWAGRLSSKEKKPF